MIRAATAADIPACVDIRGRTRENAIPVERLATLGITASSWAGQVARGALQGRIAEVDGVIAGYCFGDVATGEVVVLAVLPEHESRGLGRALLAATMADLHAHGHARLFLGCSADPRHRAHGFYRHLGWRPTGARDERGDEVLAFAFED